MMNLVMNRVRNIRQLNVRSQISENKVKFLRSRMKIMISMNIYIKVSKFEKHAPQWRKTQTPVRNSCFSGSGFSTPPRNLTALVYLKSFWLKQTTRGEIEQLIGIQMYMSIVNLLAYVLFYYPIAHMISINRYNALCQYLYVNNNSKRQQIILDSTRSWPCFEKLQRD